MSTTLRVTHVALTSTPDAKAAGRPELTPELLSATGARYSRSIDGLEVILSKIDPSDMESGPYCRWTGVVNAVHTYRK